MQVVEAVIRESGDATLKDMSNEMKAVMARLAGQAVDGKQVSELLRSRLSKGRSRMTTTRRLSGVVLLSLLLGGLAGCHYYEEFRLKKTEADVQGERAALMKAYRKCMQRYESEPRTAREYCSAYTQSPERSK